MRYLPYSGHRKVWQTSVSILLVQRNGPRLQEETARKGILQPRTKRAGHGQTFASGLLLGTLAALGMTRWLLESQSRKTPRRQQDVFSWPDIVKSGRK